MFPSFCGATGTAGWLLMLLVLGVLIAVVVWAITRLFPDRTPPTPPSAPTPPPQNAAESIAQDAAKPIVGTGRR